MRLLILFFPIILYAGNYTLKDLDALSNLGGHEELLLHAKDVPPRERDDVWYSLVRGSLSLLIGTYEASERYDKASFTLIENVSTWPELQGDSPLLAKRNNYFITYFTKCAQKPLDAPNCQNEINDSWTKGHQSIPFATLILSKLSPLYPLLDTTPMLSKIAKSNRMNEQSCNDPVIKPLLLKKLESENELTFASKECYQTIEDELLKHHNDYRSPLFVKSYNILKNNNRLTPYNEKLFSILYLLSSPTKGQLFNTSWNQLSSLKENFNEREQLLLALLKLDPLPDRSFKDFSDRDRVILIKEFSKNFPEYLDEYFKRCLKFYQGKGDFKNGNPTVNCREFYKAIKGSTLINEGLQKAFADLHLNEN